ncbi:hypothetical protein VTJ04DRAFT_2953 [Mycothermus thermophilus]|uniref:uncharacterized protein n=1 Tax=Humicola insolens TaxID=85995 RepID=UPI0037446416
MFRRSSVLRPCPRQGERDAPVGWLVNRFSFQSWERSYLLTLGSSILLFVGGFWSFLPTSVYLSRTSWVASTLPCLLDLMNMDSAACFGGGGQKGIMMTTGMMMDGLRYRTMERLFLSFFFS